MGSKSYLMAGDGEKKRHTFTVRCKRIPPHAIDHGTLRLEITTNSLCGGDEPFVMDVSGGETFTIVIEEAR